MTVTCTRLSIPKIALGVTLYGMLVEALNINVTLLVELITLYVTEPITIYAKIHIFCVSVDSESNMLSLKQTKFVSSI
jgi:hypothetical protein